jgi:OOP family OmpA-OmpF porin
MHTEKLMRTPFRIVMCATATALLVAQTQLGAQLVEMRGAKDHPAISRYAGSLLLGFEERKFDEFVLPLGAAIRKGTEYAASKSEKLQGRVTRFLYIAPAGRTTLEVMRNYELELKKGGFQTMYACSMAECSKQEDAMVELLYPDGRQLRRPADNQANNALANAFAFPEDQRYLAAKRSGPGSQVHLSLYVAKNGNPGVIDVHGRAVVLLDVIEGAAMETGMVSVDASAMAKEIAQQGQIALYGIFFDTNRAEVKPESKGTLQEIAKLLKQDANLRLLVVGHTDNVGAVEANVALSERRAAAVVRELTTVYGVAAARLRPVGVGMAAPVSRNDTEDGRAKNRRVALVKM